MPGKSAWGNTSFQDILSSEVRQSANLERARAKPLSSTQREEKAIEELRAFYGADANFEEDISVVRVCAGPMAAPLWNRHS